MTPDVIRNIYTLHWAAVIIYVFASVFFALGFWFEKERGVNLGIILTMLGIFPHSGALLIHWIVSGHGPYLSRTESYSSSAWIILVSFLLITFFMKKLKSIGLLVVPSCFLLMAVAAFSKPDIATLPPTFQTLWLIIHIFFAKLSFGAIVLALGCSMFFLIKEKKGAAGLLIKLPSMDELDEYSYRFCGFCFVCWTITVSSGSIWAFRSWGRYWGWDPVETWSLFTWLTLGLYMHLRKFYGLKQGKASLYLILCFLSILAAFYVVPFISDTIHAEFLV